MTVSPPQLASPNVTQSCHYQLNSDDLPDELGLTVEQLEEALEERSLPDRRRASIPVDKERRHNPPRRKDDLAKKVDS